MFKTKKYIYSNIHDCYCVKPNMIIPSRHITNCSEYQINCLLETMNVIEYRTHKTLCCGYNETIIIHCLRCQIDECALDSNYQSLCDLRSSRF